MTDPLDALRAPLTPVDPDPAFATRLRARLERALGLPEGVAVTETALTPAGPETPAPPADRGAAVPYLAVRGARAALDWYAQVLGARLRDAPVIMPDGRVGHAELELPHGVVYLAEEHPEIGFRAPDPAGVPVSLVLDVASVDEVIAAAVEAGARLDRRPYEAHGHRNATVTDPYGHRWMLQAPLPGAAAAPAGPGRAGAAPLRQGDISYASLWVPDVARAAAFYGAVLGLDYRPGHGQRGMQAPGVVPPQGLWEQPGQPALFCSYVVDDAGAAVARVRAAGGRAEEPVTRPYGLTADCADPDGMRFALHQPRPGAPRPAQAGTAQAGAAQAGGAQPQDAAAAGRDGDLAYLTLEAPDAARTLAFYGSVLGWRSRPGRTPGGWQVEDTRPLIGVAGGRPAPAAVPMWRVSDLAAAVARVRAAGGTATEPHREPYGLMAECTDDQGTRFYLGQLPG
jgi:predicted enzyme related to lactoylglutathione lyase